MTLFDWLSNGVNLAVAILAMATTFSAATAFKRLFIDKSGATREDLKDDGRKTREGMEHLSRQGAAEGKVSNAGHRLTHKLVAGELHERVNAAVDAGLLTDEQLTRIHAKVTEKIGVEGAQQATENIAQAASRSSDEVQQLLADGKFIEAGAAQQRLAEAGNAKQAELWRDTARIKVLTSIKEAIIAYARAVDLDPTHFWTWIELSRLHQAAGSLPQARRTAEAALQHVGNDWDRMIAGETLGDIAFDAGQLPLAKAHYAARLGASEAILALDPDDCARLREVAVSHVRLGHVARAEGQLAGAQKAYGASLTIVERLVAADPGNAAWQLDLWSDYSLLGDLALAEGDIIGARMLYETGLGIVNRLIDVDLDQTEWQFVRSMSYNKLGDVACAEGDPERAFIAYAISLDIRERLAAADPSNAKCLYYLSLSHEKIGDVICDQGDLDAAYDAYAASLSIRKRLADSDPSNTAWQRDLSVIHNRLGEVLRLQGDFARARAAFAAAFRIAKRLAAVDPRNAEWQRDLCVGHAKFAELNEGSGDVAGAIREFEAGEAILVELLARVGDHPGFARDLAQVREDVARLRGA